MTLTAYLSVAEGRCKGCRRDGVPLWLRRGLARCATCHARTVPVGGAIEFRGKKRRPVQSTPAG